MEEENKEKKIMEEDLTDTGMGKPQSSPPSHPSSPGEERSRSETRRIEEENKERKIIEADLVDTGKGKPQLPPFNPRSLRKNLRNFSNTKGGFFDVCGAVLVRPTSLVSNDSIFRYPIKGSETLDEVMEALVDPNTHIIGFHCSNENAIKATVERVTRRADCDKIFDVILKVTIPKEVNVILKTLGIKKSNTKRIQDEIAAGLKLNLGSKSTIERADELQNIIKTKSRILIILDKLYNGIDLEKVGIPYGANHNGCKILFTSPSEDVLSQMKSERNFRI